jgi:hypothetical protein
MIGIWILSGALVAGGLYINFLTWKLGRMYTHLENQGVIITAMIQEMEGIEEMEGKDGGD